MPELENNDPNIGSCNSCAVVGFVYFFPLFLIPPCDRGPLVALAAASFRAFSCSFFFLRNSTSFSSRSFSLFLGAFRGFFFPPSLPDILEVFLKVRDQRSRRCIDFFFKNLYSSAIRDKANQESCWVLILQDQMKQLW